MRKFWRKNKIIIAILIAGLLIAGALYLREEKQPASSCENLPRLPDNATKRVTKVLDGDTFIIEGGHSVRLLGIDADESGYPCHEEGKRKLEELVLNKEVELIKGATNHDQYCRYLRYPFVEGKNVSLQLIRQGVVVSRFFSNQTKYKEEITQAEQQAKENKVGCKWQDTPAEEEGFSSSSQTTFEWKELTTAKLGYDVVGPCQAGNYIGRELIVQGKVVDSYHDTQSNTVFLNFDKPHPNQCFNAVIFSSNLHKFVEDPEDFYKNKTVRIMGEVKDYKGSKEIILEDPKQIEVGDNL